MRALYLVPQVAAERFSETKDLVHLGPAHALHRFKKIISVLIALGFTLRQHVARSGILLLSIFPSLPRETPYSNLRSPFHCNRAYSLC